MSSDAVIIHESKLFKPSLSDETFVSWKECWFSLSSQNNTTDLSYYENVSKTIKEGSIDVTEMLEIDSNHEETSVFTITVKDGKKYKLKAQNEAEKTLWVEKLSECRNAPSLPSKAPGETPLTSPVTPSFESSLSVSSDTQEETNESPALRKLKEQLTCSICLGTFKDPKLLQCNHTYCRKCLSHIVQKDKDGQFVVSCPTCRKVTPILKDGLEGLVSDFRVNQLLEIVKEDWKKTPAATSKKTEKSVPMPAPAPPKLVRRQSSVTISCSEHSGKNLSLFCETCSEVICLKCIKKGEKHNMHNCEELDEAFERYKSHEIPSALQTTKKALTQLNVRCEEISNQRADIEAEIRKTVTHDGHRAEHIDQLHDFSHKKLKSLALQIDDLETIEAQLNGNLHSMTENTLKGSRAEILLKKSTILREVEDVISSLQPDILEPNEEANIVFSASEGDYGKVFIPKPKPDDSANYCDLNMQENIGNGAFGAVFKATFKGRPCAAKLLTHLAQQIATRGLLNAAAGIPTAALDAFNKECEFLESLRHENIVSHLANCTEPTSKLQILVMELMDCSLKDLLKKDEEKKISLPNQLSMCLDIVKGLAFLHSNNIIHRDLCDVNILVTLKGDECSVLKIADFGMSRVLPRDFISATLTGLGHRLVYLPVEAMEEPYHYTCNLDTYSFGVIAVQIVHKKTGLKMKSEVTTLLNKIPASHALKDVIRCCLLVNRRNRPEAADVIKMINLD